MPTITLQKTTAGRNLFRDSAKGANISLIKYFAVGTSSTSPAAGNTTLGAEVSRKAITAYTNNGDGGVLIDVYIAPSELVGTEIEEVGVFGGTSANSSTNSGVLLARGLYSHTKTNTESILLQLSLSFS